MTAGWNRRELRDELRRLSAPPPDDGFQERLNRSLSLAAVEIRVSRQSPARPSRRVRARSVSLVMAALAVAALTVAGVRACAGSDLQPGSAEPRR